MTTSLAKIKRIAKKKADEASSEVRGEILGTVTNTDLDTIGEIQSMLEGTHTNDSLNNIVRASGSASSASISNQALGSLRLTKTNVPTNLVYKASGGGFEDENGAAITLPGVNSAGNQSTSGNAATASAIQDGVTDLRLNHTDGDGAFLKYAPPVNAMMCGHRDFSVDVSRAAIVQYDNGITTIGSGNADIKFKPNGTDKMTLTTAGALTVGDAKITTTGNFITMGHKDVTNAISDPAFLQQNNGATFLQYGNGTDLIIREGGNPNGTEHARFDAGGFFGIGTADPEAPLHVTAGDNTSSSTPGGNNRRLFFGFDGNGNIVASGSNRLRNDSFAHSGQDDSIRSTGCIITERFFMAARGAVSSSDSRIKSDITEIADSEALNLCNQLKPKRYTYKDVVVQGPDPVIGFIAQEVKEHIPEAVFERTEYIPNIYQVAVKNEDVLEFASSIEFETIRNGGKIKVYDFQGREHYVDVASASDTTITLSEATQIQPEWLEENHIFVYGCQIPDFHVLKKEMIIPIAVGGIQELDRIQIKQSEEIVRLKKEIASFKNAFRLQCLKMQSDQDVIGNEHKGLAASIADQKASQVAQHLLHQDHVDSLESELALVRRENEAIINENVTLRGANAALLEKQTDLQKDLLEYQTTQSEKYALLLQQQVAITDQNVSNEQRLLKMERTSNTLLLHQLRGGADRVAELEKKCAPNVNDAGDEGSG